MQSVCEQLGNWVDQAEYCQYEENHQLLQREQYQVSGGNIIWEFTRKSKGKMPI